MKLLFFTIYIVMFLLVTLVKAGGDSEITILSQNASDDVHSTALDKLVHNGDDSFKNRMDENKKTINTTAPDIITFNEVRTNKHLDDIKKTFPKEGYQVHFSSNVQLTTEEMKARDSSIIWHDSGAELSFRNTVIVPKNSAWELDEIKTYHTACKDVAFNENTFVSATPFLSKHYDSTYWTSGFPQNCRDQFGRCVQVAKLKHKTTGEPCVLVNSHPVTGVGKSYPIKKLQWEAIFSATEMKEYKGLPIIFVGDMNRFNENRDDFQSLCEEKDLKEYKCVEQKRYQDGKEVKSSKKPEDIGTFVGHPVDSDKFLLQNIIAKGVPLSESCLDAVLYNNNVRPKGEGATCVATLSSKDEQRRIELILKEKKSCDVCDVEKAHHSRREILAKTSSDHLGVLSTLVFVMNNALQP